MVSLALAGTAGTSAPWGPSSLDQEPEGESRGAPGWLLPVGGHPQPGVGGAHDERVTRLTATLRTLLAGPPSLVVLDTAPALGVRAAAALARLGACHPLLLLPRWPYANAVLPAAPLLAALVDEARALPRQLVAPSALLVLDGERQVPLPGRPPDDPRADNRFDLWPEDLPDAPALLGLGVSRVVDLRAPGEPVPARLASAYAAYERAGLAVTSRSLA